MEQVMYTARVMGWMTVVEAGTRREALRIAKARARSCSLFPSDVTMSHVKPATDEDKNWYLAMQ